MLKIPMFSRKFFNESMRANYATFGIIPTDEAYDSYRHFVLNRYAPIGTGPVVVGESTTEFYTVEKLQENTMPFVTDTHSEIDALIRVH